MSHQSIIRHGLLLGTLLAACSLGCTPEDPVSLGGDGGGGNATTGGQGGSTGPDCAPMDAAGSGQCDESQGVMWDGSECVGIAGCECVGSDCDAVYGSFNECNGAQGLCNEDACSFSDSFYPCDGGTYCAVPNYGCDYPGVCTPRPTSCSEVDLTPVCGCDNEPYDSPCHAEMNGTGVAYFGPCN